MRFVLVSHASGFHGAEHILYNLSLVLKDLVREGKVEGLVVVLPKYGELARRLEGVVDFKVIPMSWWVAPRVQFYSELGSLSYILSANPYLFLFLSSLLIPFSVLALSRFIKRFGGDLIWSNSVVNPCGAFSSAILRKKHIWHIHEVYGDVNLFFPTKKIFDIAYALSSKLVCVSNFVAKNLFPNKKINDEKISVIYNSPSPEREKILVEVFQRKISGKISEREKGKEKIIGVIGKISPKKNQIFAVKVFYHLKQRLKDLKLVFFGDEDKRYGAKLRKVVQRLGLSDSVVFAGFKSNIQDIYESIDVLLVPYVFETSSLVCIEAMASGVPIIAHDVGALGETVGDTGIVIKSGSEEEIIQDFVFYAEKLLQDADFYFEVVRKQFRRFQEYFSFESFSQKIKSLILSL
ncbi:MAG: glycosyltransferase family 4 protein [Candidatus Calescibacterium sp.]|jgi:glycosyltransferase involved in cell wall biosynthesis|nr:glycosyltransferase family 4 protein [Candidatus Calescibacterium sp.]